MSDKVKVEREVARLVQFGIIQHLLEPWDRIPVTNALLDLLALNQPYELEVSADIPESAVDILETILDYAAAVGIIPENTTTQRDLLDAKIMGILLPRQSEVIRNFWQTVEQQSIQQATDDYYKFSAASNYIRMDRINKNRYWKSPTDYGELEITINLSKPEKDPREIAAERNMPQSSYPKCLLCIENVGYSGRSNHPARQNHRVIPLQLDGSQWFLQYSPYVYYNEHSIIFCEQHIPMKITRNTFVRLLDFVGQFPHYFIGSNADLPIVGGSILNHDHFQGGRHCFPMEKAPVEIAFNHEDYRGIKVGLVKWPMSVVRISGLDPNTLINMADLIYENWKVYSDPRVDIMAESIMDGVSIRHNTITPIARVNAVGEYELDLVLRNNRTTLEHPMGIFHPHQELHHIKKENIGLIEVMGLAVLPGRLKLEMEQITCYLTGESQAASNRQLFQEARDPLNNHASWIEQLREKYGTEQTRQAAESIMKLEIGNKFLAVLKDAGVYKRDTLGLTAFKKFMNQLDFQ